MLRLKGSMLNSWATIQYLDFFPIKRYLKRMNQIDTVDLYNVRETLCKGLKDEDIVNGKYRDPKLMLKIARFHLSANN